MAPQWSHDPQVRTTGLEVNMDRDLSTDLDQTTELMSNRDVNQEITQTSVSSTDIETVISIFLEETDETRDGYTTDRGLHEQRF